MSDDENVSVIPTRGENGEYAVCLAYASENFEEDIPTVKKTVSFSSEIVGKQVTVWCIDRENTNPYRTYERLGITTEPTEEQIELLREEGRLKPVAEFVAEDNTIEINMTPNSVFLITVV